MSAKSKPLPARRASAAGGFRPVPDSPPVDWTVADGPVPYPDAVAAMERRAARIAEGAARELVWLLEHPPLYTAGTSARDGDLLQGRFPVHRTGRGGQYTYHGPGQRIGYVMLDLGRRRQDVRAFVAALEDWIIGALGRLDIRGERRDDRVGVWVARPDKAPGLGGAPAEDKVAALGIRLKRWVSLHGVSINVAPDLSHFGGIVPCGIAAAHHGVTSLADLGRPIGLAAFDALLRAEFERVFGATELAGADPVAEATREGDR